MLTLLIPNNTKIYIYNNIYFKYTLVVSICPNYTVLFYAAIYYCIISETFYKNLLEM